jgi:hypothetical protein
VHFWKYNELLSIMLYLILNCYIVSSYIKYLVHSEFFSIIVTILATLHGSELVIHFNVLSSKPLLLLGRGRCLHLIY